MKNTVWILVGRGQCFLGALLRLEIEGEFSQEKTLSPGQRQAASSTVSLITGFAFGPLRIYAPSQYG